MPLIQVQHVSIFEKWSQFICFCVLTPLFIKFSIINVKPELFVVPFISNTPPLRNNDCFLKHSVASNIISACVVLTGQHRMPHISLIMFQRFPLQILYSLPPQTQFPKTFWPQSAILLSDRLSTDPSRLLFCQTVLLMIPSHYSPFIHFCY